MKIRLILMAALLFTVSGLYSQEDITVIAASSEAAEGLDLKALGELFRNSKSVEDFEVTLNDPNTGVNNLDLDNDGFVDFIRVIDESYGDVHVLILQVPLSNVEFQDVATIEIERTGDEYNMQIHGNEMIYGYDYYIEPVRVYFHRWPIIVWIYRPYYRPYRSAYYWGYYPSWWRPYQPALFSAYRVRTDRYVHSAPFAVTHSSRVHGVRKVNYIPKSSTLVRKGTVSGAKAGAVGTRQSSATSGGSAVKTKKSVHTEGVTVTGKKKGSITTGKTNSATVTKKKVETPEATTTKKVTKTPKQTTVQTTKKTASGKTVSKKTTVSNSTKKKTDTKIGTSVSVKKK